jgi:GNAT superfamily N-acetyltransferase
MKGIEFLDVDCASADTCRYCAANPLGQERKRAWVKQCLPFGLRYRAAVESATGKAAGMIEYMPGEFAWRAVDAPAYMVIHCLFVPHQWAGGGLGSLLLDHCIEDARKEGMAGVAALTTSGTWCADSRIYLKNGFEVVDRAPPAFELVARRLRAGRAPSCGDWEGRLRRLSQGIYLYNSKQCPFMRGERNLARREWLKAEYGLDAQVIEVGDHEQAQANPCVWGTSGVVCGGQIVNHVRGGDAGFRKALKKLGLIG